MADHAAKHLIIGGGIIAYHLAKSGENDVALWKKVGSLKGLEARRLATMARSFGLEMNIITPDQAKALFAYIDTTGREGAGFHRGGRRGWSG